uniref:MORN-repeat protein n=1 Tax=viral metagenome TaxID=1070528 RepID=A0A6C0ECB3_9ZZZZ
MDIIEKLKSTFKDYFDNPKYVYKCIGDKYLIIFSKLDNTKILCSHIVDEKYAMYSANKLFVEKIININEMTECDEVSETISWNPVNYKLKYVTGQIIKKLEWTDGTTLVHNSWIEHYKNIEPAYFNNLPIAHHNTHIKGFNGKYCKWYKSGQLWIECMFENGNSLYYKSWHNNGQLYEDCIIYRDTNNWKRIETKFYSPTGKLHMYCCNKDGVYIVTTYYDNEKVQYIEEYRDQKLIKYQEWDKEGNKTKDIDKTKNSCNIM